MCLLVLFQDMRLSHAFIPGTPMQAYSLHSFLRRRYKCPQVTKTRMPTTQVLNLYFSWMLKGKGSQAIWVRRSLAYSPTETYKISVIYTHIFMHVCVCIQLSGIAAGSNLPLRRNPSVITVLEISNQQDSWKFALHLILGQVP